MAMKKKARSVPARSALRRTLAIIRPHLGGKGILLTGGSAALLLEVVFRVLEPWPLKYVIDAVTRSLGADLASPGPAASLSLLLICAVALVSIVGLRALCNYLATVAFALAGSQIATDLRQRLFAHVTRLSQRFHSQTRTGDLVQRLISDVGRLQEVAVTAGLPLLANCVTLVAMTGVMLWLDPLLALVVVAAAALFVISSRSRSGQITAAARKTRRSEGDLANLAQETLGAIRVVQSYGLENQLAERFGTSNRRSLTDGVRSRKLAAGLERRTDLLVGIATAVVLLVGGWRVMQGAMTPGDLVIFTTYLKTALKPLRDLAKSTGRIARASASGERVADLLDVVPDIRRPIDPRYPRTAERGEIVLDEVYAGYVAGKPVLRGVDLHIPPGQRVALMGPSGSGKSTIAALLHRMMDPVAGRIRIDQVDIRNWDLAELRAQTSVVLQESVLFTGTIADNIRMGSPEATDDEVIRAARAAQAHEFIQAMPHGYDTEVGERGATMSGGQRQRIAIARALLRDTPIVILDEVTTGLDAENTAAVLAALEQLTAGRTTLVITHDELTAAACDRTLWLDQGHIVRDSARELVTEGAS